MAEQEGRERAHILSFIVLGEGGGDGSEFADAFRGLGVEGCGNGGGELGVFRC